MAWSGQNARDRDGGETESEGGEELHDVFVVERERCRGVRVERDSERPALA